MLLCIFPAVLQKNLQSFRLLSQRRSRSKAHAESIFQDQRMASALKKFGEAALKARYVNGHWHKPKVSARSAADLKKQAAASGKPWPFPEEESNKPDRPFGQYKRLKGHKHEKEKAARLEDIAKKMQEMPQKIAAYRALRKLKETSLPDMLVSTAKERRLKQYRTPNQK